MSVFVNLFDGTRACYDVKDFSKNSSDLLHHILEQKSYPCHEVQLLHNGRVVGENDPLREDGTYYVILGLKGGKGGFGAMLRMLGAQIEKTTNREACRDLSGRRMRDVNNEKQLQSWIEKSKQLEEERAKRRREKLERMRSQPKHYFVDPSYDQQREDVTESLEEAVSKGIDAAGPSGSKASSSGPLKRKVDEEDDSDDDDDDIDDPEFKKLCSWLGVDGYADLEEEGSITSTQSNDGSYEDSVDESTSKSAQPASSTSQLPSPLSQPSSQSASAPASPASSSSAAVAATSSSSSDEVTERQVNEDDGSEDASSSKNALLSSLPPPTNEEPSSSSPSSSAQSTTESGPVDVEQYSSAAELETLGLDRLKSALMERGMKCGGTLQERAQRLYSVKGLDPGDIDPSLLAKSSKGKKGKKK